MTVDEYLTQLETRVLLHPLVTHVQTVARKDRAVAGYLRLRAQLAGGQWLELFEYIELQTGVYPMRVTYSYQWMTSDGGLLGRWDNTPHHRTLPNFPHHYHAGEEDNLVSSIGPDIGAVLDEIAQGRRP